LTQGSKGYHSRARADVQSEEVHLGPAQSCLEGCDKGFAHSDHLISREKLFGIYILDEMDKRKLVGVDGVIFDVDRVALDWLDPGYPQGLRVESRIQEELF